MKRITPRKITLNRFDLAMLCFHCFGCGFMLAMIISVLKTSL